MQFHEFVQLMHKYIGCEKQKQEYVLYLTGLIVRDPLTEKEMADDNFNPMNTYDDLSIFSKIYNGTKGRKIPKDKARILQGRFSKTKFLDAFYYVEDDARSELVDALQKYGIDSDISNVDEVCAELFKRFISAMADGQSEIDTSDKIRVDAYGTKRVAVDLSSVYVENGKLHVDTELIALPEELIPGNNLRPEELPYTDAILKAYESALQKPVSFENLDSLPGRYRKDFSSQRRSFYAADWLRHSVETVFTDGENRFASLKQEAYDIIEGTYFNPSHANGYVRLLAVTDRLADATLNTSSLMKIGSLVRAVHKKGICHLLVNDKTIMSWVDVDEECV